MKGINIEENSDGVQVSFNEESVEFDVNTLNLETLRTIEEGAVSAILSHLEEHIMCLPFIRMVLLSELEEGLDDKCDYIYNYADNMRKVNDCLNKFI